MPISKVINQVLHFVEKTISNLLKRLDYLVNIMSTNSRSLLSIEATAGAIEKLFKVLSTSQKYTLLTVIDISLFLTSIAAAIGFSAGFDRVVTEIGGSNKFVVMEIVVKIGLFWYFGIYRQVLRHTSWEFLFATVKSVTIASVVIAAISHLFPSLTIPASILINDGILTLFLAIGFRLLVRLLLDWVRQTVYPKPNTYRAIVYGAGSAGCILAQSLAGADGERSIGFVDDNPGLQGRNIQGKRVYAPSELRRLKESNGFDTILLAMPSIDGERKREILAELQTLGVPIKTVPSITEILSGHVSVNKVRELDIEDLLGRKQIAPNPELLQHDILDRVVLVTGAGGSIGSELCRQIAKQQPKLLLMYELHEFSLYRVDLELGEEYPALNKLACLGSVTDANAFNRVLKQYRVQTIYHAAAYKHVPMVEANPVAGTLNNIGGTLTAAQCAIDSNVEKFVLISTDKAVRPTNIMGATKRVAEIILQALADLPTHHTCFTMVRFGNVLGSSGSVVPRFREQIAAGKSIAVTHAEITRYFMTIPEAAALVIQAGAMAKGGEVFLLDMGEPVKIYDLAAQMIRLHGMEPGREIEIEITGLRPGEKIYEELLLDCDGAIRTGHPKIFCAREAKLDWQDLCPQLTQLIKAATDCEVDECVSIVRHLVPEYQPMGQYAGVASLPVVIGTAPIGAATLRG
jgi:FlaA1/EpsC-like NDP-sugar epimerase